MPAVRRLIRGARPGHWVVASGLVTSLSNFLVLLIAGRTLSPFNFGQFAAVSAITLFLAAIQRNAVLEPLLTVGPSNASDSAESGALTVCAGFAAAVAIVFLPASYVLGALSDGWLGIAVAAFILEDCLRYVAFSLKRPLAALAADTSMLLVFALIAIPLTLLRGGALGLNTVWSIWAGSSVAGVLILFALGRVPRPSFRASRAFLRRTRRLTPWLLAQTALSSAVSQLVPIFCASIVGTAAYGGFRATQTLFQPINVVVSASQPAVLARMARRYQAAQRSFRRILLRYALALSAVVGILGLGIVWWSRAILSAVFGSDFAKYATLTLPLWGLVTLMSAALVIGNGLRVRAQGRQVFLSQVLASVVGACLLPILSVAWGIHGLVLALVAQAVVIVIAGAVFFVKQGGGSTSAVPIAVPGAPFPPRAEDNAI